MGRHRNQNDTPLSMTSGVPGQGDTMISTGIRRVGIDATLAEALTKRFTNHVHEVMSTKLDLRLKEADLARKAVAPVLSLIENQREAFSALKQLENLRMAAAKVDGPSAMPTRFSSAAFPSLTGITSSGLTIIGPPFDIPWTDARGNEHGNRYADAASGSFGFNTGSVTGDWSSQSAGMGVIITTPTPLNVQITPDATYDYAWADSAGGATSHTNGLVGLLVQDIDGAGTFPDIRQNLWSDGTGWFESHDGNGNGFVQNFISMVNVSMAPGHRYVIWTWTWGESDGNLASCRLDARLFVLVVSASV